MADEEDEVQLSFYEHLQNVLKHMENNNYHHAKASTHEAKLYSEVMQEITILNK